MITAPPESFRTGPAFRTKERCRRLRISVDNASLGAGFHLGINDTWALMEDTRLQLLGTLVKVSTTIWITLFGAPDGHAPRYRRTGMSFGESK